MQQFHKFMHRQKKTKILRAKIFFKKKGGGGREKQKSRNKWKKKRIEITSDTFHQIISQLNTKEAIYVYPKVTKVPITNNSYIYLRGKKV